MSDKIIIYDTEYTSWKGCLENGWVLPKRKEIVQIAALKIQTKTLEVEEEFCRFIIPTYNPVLSDYFVQLTGITNEKIQKEGCSFAQAYADFVRFSEGFDCYAYAFPPALSPDADGAVMKLNLEWNNLPESKLCFKNIAFWFEQKFKENNLDLGRPSSGQLAACLGRKENLSKLGLDVHNALYDVYSLLEGLRYFSKNFSSF